MLRPGSDAVSGLIGLRIDCYRCGEAITHVSSEASRMSAHILSMTGSGPWCWKISGESNGLHLKARIER